MEKHIQDQIKLLKKANDNLFNGGTVAERSRSSLQQFNQNEQS